MTEESNGKRTQATQATQGNSDSKSKHDAFLASMTFTKMGEACDCDECGINEVPVAILQAVENHKRMKREKLREANPKQERKLVVRDGGLSIWKITMPPGAEPLTEFGGSHRFVVIDQLENRTVKSIGKGIIGSSSEEEGRKKVNWKKGMALFFKSNGGKAIGWVNERQDSDKGDDVDKESKNVIIYAIKVTQALMESPIDDSMKTKGWAPEVLHMFHKYLKNESIDLDSDDTETLQKLVKEKAAEKGI